MVRIAKRMRRALVSGLALGALAAVGLQATSAANTESPQAALIIGGTGTALGGMQLLADAFAMREPTLKVEVLPSLGSGGGIKALAADKIDLALSARPLKDAEQASGLTAALYARTPIVFATNKKTPADAIALDQLPSIYDGTVSSWPDGTPLRLIRRPETESDTQLLRGLSPEMDAAVQIAMKRPELYVAINDQDNATALEQVPGSLGLTTLAQILSENRDLKPLVFDGSVASVERLHAGDYPHFKELHLVTKAIPSDTVKAFVSFLYSEAGRALLEANGHDVIGAGN